MSYNSKRWIKITVATGLIISGWLALGTGYTTRSSLNGFIFNSGFILIVLGIIVLLIKIRK